MPEEIEEFPEVFLEVDPVRQLLDTAAIFSYSSLSFYFNKWAAPLKHEAP